MLSSYSNAMANLGCYLHNRFATDHLKVIISSRICLCVCMAKPLCIFHVNNVELFMEIIQFSIFKYQHSERSVAKTKCYLHNRYLSHFITLYSNASSCLKQMHIG